ncbi:hypothetical protein B7486_09930 [cyanobacterium TDX16]|nr:hypothetical protein B7486_09930 [cyanobacterium TDX16]
MIGAAGVRLHMDLVLAGDISIIVGTVERGVKCGLKRLNAASGAGRRVTGRQIDRFYRRAIRAAQPAAA